MAVGSDVGAGHLVDATLFRLVGRPEGQVAGRLAHRVLVEGGRTHLPIGCLRNLAPGVPRSIVRTHTKDLMVLLLLPQFELLLLHEVSLHVWSCLLSLGGSLVLLPRWRI